MFTNDHYDEFVKILGGYKPRKPDKCDSQEEFLKQEGRCNYHSTIVSQIANWFFHDNPWFDRQKFINTIGPSEAWYWG